MLLRKGKTTDETVSILGKGAEIAGEISFAGELRVNGIIKGKIRSEGILIIGPEGKVDAEIDVTKISVNGEFRGVIRASDRVEIHKDGRVFGDIFAPCLIIESGATFEGRCNMSNKKIPKQEEGSLRQFQADPAKTSQAAAGQ